MKTLTSDINLGGSTLQYLSWSKRNLTRDSFVSSIEKQLSYRAKTKPCKMARRLGSLIGVIYDKFGGDDYLLDCVIEAFNNIEKRSR